MPTMSETTLDKQVVMNGQLLPGVQKVEIIYDINQPVVELTIVIKVARGSLKLDNNLISFETVCTPKDLK